MCFSQYQDSFAVNRSWGLLSHAENAVRWLASHVLCPTPTPHTWADDGCEVGRGIRLEGEWGGSIPSGHNLHDHRFQFLWNLDLWPTIYREGVTSYPKACFEEPSSWLSFTMQCINRLGVGLNGWSYIIFSRGMAKTRGGPTVTFVMH